MSEGAARNVEITKVDADDFRLTVEAGWPMANGEQLYSFSVCQDGCTEVRCAQTAPGEQIHICHLAELHRLLGEVLKLAREHGFEVDE